MQPQSNRFEPPAFPLLRSVGEPSGQVSGNVEIPAGLIDRIMLYGFGSRRAQICWWMLIGMGFVAFGVLVEIRSAFLKRRMTDFGVYARAAWAVGADVDLYEITDENDWHYVYPPAFAALISPLADPPPGHIRTGALPFAASAAIWYVVSLALLAVSIEALARAVERIRPEAFFSESAAKLPTARRFLLRFLPLLAVLPHVGNTLSRGQVGFLWLAMTAGAIAALTHRQSFRAGLLLAGAITLKVIPAYLLIFAVWRRDWRMAAGCVAGLVVGLIAVPVIAMGPDRTADTYRSFVSRVLAPGIGGGQDRTLAAELTDVTSTRSQAPLCILHHWQHWEKSRYDRPGQPSKGVRIAHGLFALFISAWILFADRRSRSDAPARDWNLFSQLTTAMILISPVCHMHYFLLMLPAVMLRIGSDLARPGRISVGAATLATHVAFLAASIATLLPHAARLQDSGILTLAALALAASPLGGAFCRSREINGGGRTETFEPASVDRIAA